jgi:hypothetical protein
MTKYRVIVWSEISENDSDTIGYDYPSWDKASDAGAQYCQSSSYRYRIEQNDPN